MNISGNAFMTINAGPGTATLPPIFGAMIAYDLKVNGNGVLTINPDDPPANASAAVSGAANVHSAALNALMNGRGLNGPGALTDQEAINEVAMSLAGNADLVSGSTAGARKKTI